MKRLSSLSIILAVTALVLTGCQTKQVIPLKALVVSGQNNHNWPVSHVALKMILENSGMFKVDLAISPLKGGDFSNFNVDFSEYSLVVLDYNGDDWNPSMREAFLEYARKGGGIVVYHAADNAFAKWEEYNRIIALGGWEGRNESSGPYSYWVEGKGLVKDYTTPGRGGSHGNQFEFSMNARGGHPITKGLPEHWKHAKDELYDSMRGPANIKDLLYSASSPKQMRGSGREEPLVFTVDYGKARIFHIMIGHAGKTLEDNPAMQCAGFQELLLRGSEWCAKGKVTRKVPADFPTADKVSYRKEYR